MPFSISHPFRITEPTISSATIAERVNAAIHPLLLESFKGIVRNPDLFHLIPLEEAKSYVELKAQSTARGIARIDVEETKAFDAQLRASRTTFMKKLNKHGLGQEVATLAFQRFEAAVAEKIAEITGAKSRA